MAVAFSLKNILLNFQLDHGDGRTSFMNEHAARINLHEHEDDEKGNGLCNVIASYAA